MILLTDVLLRRQAEISRQLAALAGLHPAGVLPVIRSLPLDEITDLQARRYIAALLARWDELKDANSLAQARISAEVAFGNGVGPEYVKWVSRIDAGDMFFHEVAELLIKKIMRYQIARDVFEELADYAAECIEIARNGSP